MSTKTPTVRATASPLLARVDQVESENAGMSSRVSGLEKKVAGNARDISAQLNATSNELRDRISALEVALFGKTS